MKRKILDIDKDANNNLTVEVEYSDGKRKEVKTLNFDPTTSKVDILKTVGEANPISEKTEEEIAKEEALTTIQGKLATEVGKEVTIQAVKAI